MAAPRGWVVCRECLVPVRTRCYPGYMKPEIEHRGGNKSCVVHKQALPTVFDLEFVVGLRDVFEKARPVIQSSPAPTVVKKKQRKVSNEVGRNKRGKQSAKTAVASASKISSTASKKTKPQRNPKRTRSA